MDKFLKNKTAQITAAERQLQFSSHTHASGGKLFCTSCNIVLDHSRKSTVVGHMTSQKHLKRKGIAEKAGLPLKRQKTLEERTVATEKRDDLCREWVSVLAAANIPISKTDHPAVREFLRKRVVNGGAIPHAKQLQECYLNREASRRVEEVKAIMKGKPVAISTDEMSDANGRFVLNILAAPLELTDGRVKSYLMDTVFLENTNHSSVAAAVVKTVTKFEIEYEDVMVINTDNAAYI